MDDELREKLINCLTEQINEIDLLSAMYTKKNELVFNDVSILQEVRDFLDGKTFYSPGSIDFTLNIVQDDLKLEIFINLPTFYPEQEPNINIRCNQLNRHEETSLNKALKAFITDNHSNEVCLYTAVVWIQDNVCNFKGGTEEPKKIETKTNSETYARYWIYSHHIYNKKKRDDIVKHAKELNITGFCLSGKPGIICIEGTEDDCKEWWKIIKSLSWKKIVVKKMDLYKPSEWSKEKRFMTFEEIGFYNPSTPNHSDMSQFAEYIKQHSLTDAFNEILGFCNN